jgi:hypothetical protein
MNIKSLLLGSAAALAAVSGAHAADAIVAAEPEPLEYVRICDAYGKGYFYIPGTETCLQIGGKIRTEGNWYDAYDPDTHFGTQWHSRFELNVNTASDTELGALKTAALARFDWQEGATSGVNLIHANISLGGFLIGLDDSQYNQFVGYAGDVIHDDVIADGPYELNQATYAYDAGNGFTAVISLEDTKSGKGATGANGEDSHNHYAPDVVAGAGFKSGAWSFKVVGGYDSIVEEGAIKARVDADFGAVSAFLMGAWNTDGDKKNQYAPGDSIGQSWGDWAVWGGVGVPFNDQLKWNLQLAYTDNKTFAATTNLKWNPVKNLLIEPEVSYTNWDNVNESQWAGTLRFERNF